MGEEIRLRIAPYRQATPTSERLTWRSSIGRSHTTEAEVHPAHRGSRPQRYNPSSVAEILSSLDWLGLTPDEGPGIGGRLRPLRSDRASRNLHGARFDKLLELGAAYRCFCTRSGSRVTQRDIARKEPPATTAGADACPRTN